MSSSDFCSEYRYNAKAFLLLTVGIYSSRIPPGGVHDANDVWGSLSSGEEKKEKKEEKEEKKRRKGKKWAKKGRKMKKRGNI